MQRTRIVPLSMYPPPCAFPVFVGVGFNGVRGIACQTKSEWHMAMSEAQVWLAHHPDECYFSSELEDGASLCCTDATESNDALRWRGVCVTCHENTYYCDTLYANKEDSQKQHSDLEKNYAAEHKVAHK